MRRIACGERFNSARGWPVADLSKRRLVAIVAGIAAVLVFAGYASWDSWAGFVGPLVQAVLS